MFSQCTKFCDCSLNRNKIYFSLQPGLSTLILANCCFIVVLPQPDKNTMNTYRYIFIYFIHINILVRLKLSDNLVNLSLSRLRALALNLFLSNVKSQNLVHC